MVLSSPTKTKTSKVAHDDYMAGPRNFYAGNCEAMVLSQEKRQKKNCKSGQNSDKAWILKGDGDSPNVP